MVKLIESRGDSEFITIVVLRLGIVEDEFFLGVWWGEDIVRIDF